MTSSTAIRAAPWVLLVVLGATFAVWLAQERDRSLASRGLGGQGSEESSEGESTPVAEGGLVVLDETARERAGLELSEVRFVSRPDVRKAYGSVLPPDGFLELHHEVRRAEISLEPARADEARVRSLREDGEGASLRALEEALARRRTMELALEDARRRLEVFWGSDLTRPSSDERDEFLARWIGGRIAVLRVATPAAESLTVGPVRALVARGNGESPVTTERVVAAPRADSPLEGSAFFLVVEGDDLGLAPGAAITAELELEGTEVQGALVPLSAAIRFEARTWVYVVESPTKFRRREIRTPRRQPEGWLVPEGFAPGARVVSGGAQTLLSEELRSRIHLEEEDEE